MKRRRSKALAQVDKNEPFLLPELIDRIVSFVDKEDTRTFLTLLAVEKRAFIYVYQAVSPIWAYFLSHCGCFIGYSLTTTNTAHPEPLKRICDSIINWLDFCRGNKIMAHAKIYDYLAFCLFDTNHKTTLHCIKALSFIRLCQLHSRHLIRVDPRFNFIRPRRELPSPALLESTLKNIHYYNPLTKQAYPLSQLPGLAFTKMDMYTQKEFEEKIRLLYGENSTITSLSIEGYACAGIYRRYGIAYHFLRDELPIRTPIKGDKCRNIVIRNPTTGQYNHIFSDESKPLYANCFIHNGGATSDPGLAFFLHKNALEYEKRFLSYFNDQLVEHAIQPQQQISYYNSLDLMIATPGPNTKILNLFRHSSNEVSINLSDDTDRLTILLKALIR
jgi:hypothetical protein